MAFHGPLLATHKIASQYFVHIPLKKSHPHLVINFESTDKKFKLRP
jgi:hypothetical protein